jgi:hypothetical protein
VSGTIVFNDKADWSVSSGIFNWVNEFLADTVNDGPTRERLRLIDEQNFRWLNFADLSGEGKREILAILSHKLVPHAEEHFPHTPYRDEALGLIRELAETARAVALG